METWKDGKVYTPGEVVEHNGDLFQKDRDDDQSCPDHVQGGWTCLGPNTNVTEYKAVAAALGSYEQRKAAHKAEVMAKLAAEGLNPDDVKAVLGA